jgi:hypothetical protein
MAKQGTLGLWDDGICAGLSRLRSSRSVLNCRFPRCWQVPCVSTSKSYSLVKTNVLKSNMEVPKPFLFSEKRDLERGQSAPCAMAHLCTKRKNIADDLV